MTFSIDQWMEQYVDAVQNLFDERIWFIGLQGSYGRGEAGDSSDIDVVLILDSVTVKDLEAYSQMLDKLPQREKVCGFISGKKELLSWEPSDLFQFYHDTTPIQGSLNLLFRNIQKEDICRAIRIGACNIYHMCVHNLVHEKSMEILKNLYKSSVFTMHAIGFVQTGRYEKKRSALFACLHKEEQTVLSAGMKLKEKETLSYDELKTYSDLLIRWASKWICEANFN